MAVLEAPPLPRLVALSLVCLCLVAGCASSASRTHPLASASGSPASVESEAAASAPQASAPSWHPTANMLTPHAFHTSTLLTDGTVLVVGGLINDRVDGKVSGASERFDPGRDSWSATAKMLTPRWSHTATLLPDGEVLVAGGYIDSTESMDSAELYDPASGRWTATGSMHEGRGGSTATLLRDGRVLVVAGGTEDATLEGGPRSRTAELYDPATGTWTATASMIEARQGFTATLLPDGRVLVAGGGANFVEAEI